MPERFPGFFCTQKIPKKSRVERSVARLYFFLGFFASAIHGHIQRHVFFFWQTWSTWTLFFFLFFFAKKHFLERNIISKCFF